MPIPKSRLRMSTFADCFPPRAHQNQTFRWDRCSSLQGGEVTPVLNENGVYGEERTFPDGRIYLFTITYVRDMRSQWCEIVIVQDITARKRLEKELQAHNEDLELRVAERTRELREKHSQLAQAEKMASLGQLVAGVAHEINTPVAALASNNDLFIRSITKVKSILDDPVVLERLKESERLQGLLESIDELNRVNKDAAERIVGIIKSLRSFARLDRAEMDSVDIHEGLESTLTLVTHLLKGRIEIVRDYGDLPPVHCFPNQLNQVFMNLLVNASQAIEGPGTITIRTRVHEKKVRLEFSDTGRGIALEHVARIFDPGFTTKGSGVGTGLGLSIVSQIVADHHGTIEVASTPGTGTTFTILLPVNK